MSRNQHTDHFSSAALWCGVAASLVMLDACGSSPPPEPVAAPPPPPATAPVASAAPAPPPTAAPVTPPLPVMTVPKEAGLLAPESVLYDAESDTYLVANVNGKPADADKNGFISKIGPDGAVIALKWIDGSKPGATLDAPKGMAISAGTLYVADITWVRLFDSKTGASKGKLAVAGATFLNDVSAAPDGIVFLSDTGWKAEGDGFANTGTDAVVRIDPKRVIPAPLLRDTALGNPNGVAATADGVWVLSAKGELARVSKDGKRDAPTKLPKGGLDGLVILADGSMLVSSWEGSAVYHGKPGGEFRAILTDLAGPADIGYDVKRGRLLIPQMPKDTVVAYDLAALSGGATSASPPAPAAAPTAAAAAPGAASAAAAKPAPSSSRP
ncbi:MAG: SMP-30/gluconolactonase/LRE family protein [Polyangiaceae bacterium]|nr:SMP-30/gluconolactonase/LRE family protein [Polyangiaceae bacterium]